MMTAYAVCKQVTPCGLPASPGKENRRLVDLENSHDDNCSFIVKPGEIKYSKEQEKNLVLVLVAAIDWEDNAAAVVFTDGLNSRPNFLTFDLDDLYWPDGKPVNPLEEQIKEGTKSLTDKIRILQLDLESSNMKK